MYHPFGTGLIRSYDPINVGMVEQHRRSSQSHSVTGLASLCGTDGCVQTNAQYITRIVSHECHYVHTIYIQLDLAWVDS